MIQVEDKIQLIFFDFHLIELLIHFDKLISIELK